MWRVQFALLSMTSVSRKSLPTGIHPGLVDSVPVRKPKIQNPVVFGTLLREETLVMVTGTKVHYLQIGSRTVDTNHKDQFLGLDTSLMMAMAY